MNFLKKWQTGADGQTCECPSKTVSDEGNVSGQVEREAQQKVYFVRHGQTDWNAQGRIQGRMDIPLNTVGMEQARELAEQLAQKNVSVDRVVTSDLSRAYETGRIVAERLGVPCEKSHNLYEREFGDWEGLKMSEIQEKWAQLYEDWMNRRYDFRPPNGESYHELAQRMMNAVGKLLENTKENLLIVSHGGSLSAFLHEVGTTGDGQAAQRNFLGNGEIVELSVRDVLAKIQAHPGQ